MFSKSTSIIPNANPAQLVFREGTPGFRKRLARGESDRPMSRKQYWH